MSLFQFQSIWNRLRYRFAPHQAADVTQADRHRFFEELNVGNLRRMRWLILLYLPMSALIFLYGLYSDAHGKSVDEWAIAESCISVGLLAWSLVAEKRKLALRWRHATLIVYYVWALCSMTGYYFVAYPSYGETQSYTLGVLMVSVSSGCRRRNFWFISRPIRWRFPSC